MAGRQWIKEALKDFVFSFSEGASAAARTPGVRGGAASLAASIAAPQKRQDMIRQSQMEEEDRKQKMEIIRQQLLTGQQNQAFEMIKNLRGSQQPTQTMGADLGPMMGNVGKTFEAPIAPVNVPGMGNVGIPNRSDVMQGNLQEFEQKERIQTDQAMRQDAPRLALQEAARRATEEGNALARQALQQERERQEANRIADNARADAALATSQAQQKAQMDAAAARHAEDIRQRELDRAQRVATAAANAAARTTDKPPTAQNLRTFGFYMRAKDAVDILDGIEKDVQAMGTGEQFWTALMPNVLQTQLGQTLEQAQRQFTEARLRKDSGAAIPPHEYANDKKTYFVSPGDTKETLERKRNARAVLMKALANESGRAFTQSFGEPETGGGELPSGNGKVIDEATARKFYDAAGGNAEKARANALAKGWKLR